MIEPIRFTILGDPQAQKRHRHFKMKNTGQIRNYDPSQGKKADFLSVIQSNAPEIPLVGPLRIDIDFFFARPMSHFRTGKNSHIQKDNAPKWHISKPDRDNLDKFVLDAMKGIFYKDDSQVCAGEPRKMYSNQPRTEITITAL